MNTNVVIRCDRCFESIHCRIGFGNLEEQDFHFACPNCTSPINLILKLDFEKIDYQLEFLGAEKDDTETMENADHFVDLHFDFPTYYGNYEMGRTAFIRAVGRIGVEKMNEYSFVIDILNKRVKETEEINSFIRFYISENWSLFRSICHKYLPKDQFPCEKPADRNTCLYQLLELAFVPFTHIQQTHLFVEHAFGELSELHESESSSFRKFLNRIIESGFLKSIQTDCLEIYPRVLKSSRILRPAIYMDYDSSALNSEFPIRISSSNFSGHKDLFKDMSEILSRLLVLLAGISNLKLRGSHDLFDSSIRNHPCNLDEFADYPFGKKSEFIDEPYWRDIAKNIVENRLRNAIAHYKAEYDEGKQLITYFPYFEGLEQRRSETISFLEFSRKILETFRWLHRFNHLVKMLYVFNYLGSENNG